MNSPINNKQVIAGFDLAGAGKDFHALCIRTGLQIEHLEQWQSPFEDAVRRVYEKCTQYGAWRIKFDSTGQIGLSRGTFQRIVGNVAVKWIPIRLNEKTPLHFENNRNMADEFFNARAYYAKYMQNALEVATDERLAGRGYSEHALRCSPFINLETVELFHQQAEALTFQRSEKGKLKLESKEALRRRGIPSPDIFDAVLLTFFGDGDGANINLTKAYSTGAMNAFAMGYAKAMGAF